MPDTRPKTTNSQETLAQKYFWSKLLIPFDFDFSSRLPFTLSESPFYQQKCRAGQCKNAKMLVCSPPRCGGGSVEMKIAAAHCGDCLPGIHESRVPLMKSKNASKCDSDSLLEWYAAKARKGKTPLRQCIIDASSRVTSVISGW